MPDPLLRWQGLPGEVLKTVAGTFSAWPLTVEILDGTGVASSYYWQGLAMADGVPRAVTITPSGANLTATVSLSVTVGAGLVVVAAWNGAGQRHEVSLLIGTL